jgi:dUTPase
VLVPVAHARVEEVVALDRTPRGRGGFGHTGRGVEPA